MDGIGDPWELILINDGSSDGSVDIMRALRKDDSRVRMVDFVRNFGHQIAVTAGLDAARGKAVVVIDADLQDPPEVILDLITKWREGYEVVYAVRAEREGETWFKEWTAKLFYRLIFRITDVRIPMDTGDFRLLDAQVVAALCKMHERHRFLRGMAAWVGFRQIGVPYRRHARFAGQTKYPLRKMIALALNAITSFSYFPLQLATYLGFISAGIAAVAIPVVMVVAAPFISVYFLIYERNNLSKLYGILPLRRSEVVIGRYTYALLFGILNEVFSGILAYILSLILHAGISYLEFLTLFSVGFLYVCLYISIQLPLYFRFPFSKVYIFSNLPVYLVAVFLVYLVKRTDILHQLSQVIQYSPSNQELIWVVTGLGLGLLLLLISCPLSFLIHRKSEL